MKKLILITIGLLIFLSFNHNVKAQSISYMINFEDTTSPYDLKIDTISNINNIWEIGEPNKVIFDSAYTKPNAIVTDLQNPYPTNDTSSFIIYHIAQGGLAQEPYPMAAIQFRYKVDTDSLLDYGTIEFSPDNGTTWVNLLDSSNQNINYHGPPTITGKSNGWQLVMFSFTNLGAFYNIQDGDTTLFKFTFISDSIQSGKDGLMFDNIFLYDSGATGIDSYDDKANSVKVYPNPASESITVVYDIEDIGDGVFSIYSMDGKLILEKDVVKTEKQIRINTAALENGIYFYSLRNKGRFMGNGKIVLIK
jgi:hypothetical protein